LSARLLKKDSMYVNVLEASDGGSSLSDALETHDTDSSHDKSLRYRLRDDEYVVTNISDSEMRTKTRGSCARTESRTSIRSRYDTI
jgi:hypothetical protein